MTNNSASGWTNQWNRRTKAKKRSTDAEPIRKARPAYNDVVDWRARRPASERRQQPRWPRGKEGGKGHYAPPAWKSFNTHDRLARQLHHKVRPTPAKQTFNHLGQVNKVPRPPVMNKMQVSSKTSSISNPTKSFGEVTKPGGDNFFWTLAIALMCCFCLSVGISSVFAGGLAMSNVFICSVLTIGVVFPTAYLIMLYRSHMPHMQMLGVTS